MSEEYIPFVERRRREQLQGQAVIYQYEKLPPGLVHQIGHILRQVIGTPRHDLGSYSQVGGKPDYPISLWREIAMETAESLGKADLGRGSSDDLVISFLSSHELVDALTIIERAFYMVKRDPVRRYLSEYRRETLAITLSVQEAVDKLNRRFQENGFGYKLVDDYLIRIDSELVHSEVVEPALRLLQAAGFEGPEVEYLEAHEHLRHGRTLDAMNAGLRAFESTMKTICDERDWVRDPNATAAGLIRLLRDQEFFAPYHADYTTKITALLEAGVPTNRNRNSGHGAGPTPRVIDERLAAYTLHLASSNIVFLVATHVETAPEKSRGTARPQDDAGRFVPTAEEEEEAS